MEYCGIDIVSDTTTHFQALCPFHGNTHDPAFVVDKAKGLFFCFNPSCEVAGSLPDLLRKLKKMNPFQAQRLILKYKNASEGSFMKRFEEAISVPPEFVEFPQSTIDKMKANFPGSIAEEYMKSRGFDDETLDYFDVGYSAKKNMVAVPMHDPNGMPVGVIGRTPSHTDKAFKNSVNLPKSKTAWNFHRAKKTGESIIVCEASYDAMRIHQAGHPNVIALLGGHVTKFHLDQINKHFSTVIIMTDFDKKIYKPNCRACHKNKFSSGDVKCLGHRPGRDLGRSLVKGLPNKRVLWGAYNDLCVFPHGAKDASDMTDEEIRQCLKNAVPNVIYSQWDIEDVAA